MNEQKMMESLWVKLRSIDKVRAGQWQHPLDYLTAHLLLLALDGETRIAVDGILHQLDPGCAFIGLPGQLLHIPAAGNGEMFIVRFDTIEEGEQGKTGLKVTERNSRFPLAGKITLSNAAEMLEICRKAAADWQSGGTKERLRAEGALHELLCSLFEPIRSEMPDSESALSRTVMYMERHCERSITIDELAEMAGLSRYYYMRLFKTSFGVSAMDYLAELRMNKAKRLMEQSTLRLRDIARQVGYSDEFYFIRKFKQQIGIPPATYIRNRQRRIAAYSFPNIGQLLALQIVPFAAPMDHVWTDLYRRKYLADVVTRLSHNYDFNLAALRDAQPDCIIGVDAFLPPEEQERVRRIAPSLFVPWRTDDWRGHLRTIAEFLDRMEEAEAWLGHYERLAARTREQVRRFVRRETVLIAQREEDKYHVYGRKTIAGVLYEDLGLSPAACIAGIESRETVATEQLAQFGADRILLMLPGGRDVRGAWEQLASSAEWKRNAALLGAKVTPIAAWPWYDYSAFAQQQFLLATPAIFRTPS